MGYIYSTSSVHLQTCNEIAKIKISIKLNQSFLSRGGGLTFGKPRLKPHFRRPWVKYSFLPRYSDLMRSRHTSGLSSHFRQILCKPLRMLSNSRFVLRTSVVRPFSFSFSLSHSNCFTAIPVNLSEKRSLLRQILSITGVFPSFQTQLLLRQKAVLKIVFILVFLIVARNREIVAKRPFFQLLQPSYKVLHNCLNSSKIQVL